jgi:general secretion pathway protein K
MPRHSNLKCRLETVPARKSEERNGEAVRAREQGFALLVVLWVLSSAVMLVASFNSSVRSGTASAVSEVGLTKLEALLDAGFEVAAAHLIDQNKKRRWLGDGRKHSIEFSGAELSIAVTDANGLIDLNKSEPALLRAFFLKFTNSKIEASRYTDVIMRARDAAAKDRIVGVSNSADVGAQDTPPSEPAFIDVSQLGRMQGIPHDVFNEVAPFLTVFSDDGTIYPVTAPVQILEAIPALNQADIEKVRHADKSALVGLMGTAPDFLTYKSGAAHLVTVRAHRTDDDYSVARTFVIATGIDPDAPYRLLAKWPTITTAAEKSR